MQIGSGTVKANQIKTDLTRGGPNIYFVCVGPDGITIEVRAPTD